MKTQIKSRLKVALLKGYRRYKNTHCCVNELGHIISLFKDSELKGRINNNGYRVVHTSLKGTKIKLTVHEIVAHCFIGPRPNGKQINHKNGIKDDNRAENLEYCTAKENILHAWEHGLSVGYSGEHNSFSKLTEDDVILIRTLRYMYGARVCDLTRMFPEVHRANIQHIIYYRTWTHI